MRTTLKLVAPLIVSVALVSLLFAGYQVRTQKRILRNELVHRAETLGESLQESVDSLSERTAERSLQRLVDRFGQREHLRGVAVYDASGASVAMGYVPKEIADESEGFEIELLGKRLAARMQPAPLFDANLARMRG